MRRGRPAQKRKGSVVNPSGEYRAQAARLLEVAEGLEAGSVEGPVAREATIVSLEDVAILEPGQQTRAATVDLVARVRRAEAVSAEFIREIAAVLQSVANGHDEMQAQLHGIWGA